MAITACAENKPHDLPVVLIRAGVDTPYKCAYVISGDISLHLFEAFRSATLEKRRRSDCELDNAGEPASNFIKTVVIRSSRGGDLRAAFGIMNLIQQNDFVTHIHSGPGMTEFCLSSCALIFASGIHRHMTFDRERSLVLGIHKPSFVEGTYEHLQQEQELDNVKYTIIEHLSQVGVDPRFTIKMFETSFSEMTIPSLEELLVWDVVTDLEAPRSLTNPMTTQISENIFYSNLGADQRHIDRVFAYHGWLTNAQEQRREDIETVQRGYDEAKKYLNFEIISD